MIQITEKSKCCGCSSCVSSCPTHCIEFQEDSEGFLYPTVDTSKCISCGKCEKACPLLSQSGMNTATEKTEEKVSPASYVAINNDEKIRLQSSSGGIFSLFAQHILHEGGVVFGAAFCEDFSVHHIMIDDIHDLNKLRGSKYTQSKLENSFSMVKEELKNNRKVLFTGTACQIAGLKAFLGKDYQNLYTIDVLCHGVPSPKVWERYLSEQKVNNKSEIENVIFRHKSSGWKTYSVYIKFKNGKEYIKRFRRDSFMQLFLSNICLRPSCHDCAFKSLNRVSDLTIGDAWGVNDYMPEMDDDKGTSIILVQSLGGKELFQAISNNLSVREADADIILPPWSDARKSVSPNEKRQIFFRKFYSNKSSIDILSKMVRPTLATRIYYRGLNELKRIKLFRKE